MQQCISAILEIEHLGSGKVSFVESGVSIRDVLAVYSVYGKVREHLGLSMRLRDYLEIYHFGT